MRLTTSDNLTPLVAPVLCELRTVIGSLLPDTYVHHVGATSIPGAITKGDLDVLLRVTNAGFAPAVDLLRSRFPVKQQENWDPHFASFGSDTEFAVPVGIQLVIEDSEADFFLFVRDYLLKHPDALTAYNSVKLAHSESSASDYWRAKDSFLRPILAQRPKPANKAPEPTTTSVTSPAYAGAAPAIVVAHL